MDYTSDWFSGHIPVWTRFVKPLAGRPLHALEVGSYEGRSAVWMLENVLTHPDSRLNCIDIWESKEVQKRFRANIAQTGRSSQVIESMGDSATALKSIDGPFDLIYIDGSHEARFVLTDAALCWTILRPGGMLIFDDYGWSGPVEFTPRYAIDAFLQLWMTQIEVLHKDYQVHIRRRLK